MREPEVIRPLQIGLIAYNRQQAEEGLRVIAENNEEQVKYLDNNKLVLQDDTTIYVLYDSPYQLRGRRFDQLVLFDDNRWNVLDTKRDFIVKILKEYIFPWSCVPVDYIVMQYEN